MLKLRRLLTNTTLHRNFATLIVPNPGSPQSDLGNLSTASFQLPQPVDILQVGPEVSRQDMISQISASVDPDSINQIYFRTSEDFQENNYVASSELISSFLNEQDRKYTHVVFGNNNHVKEILPRLSVSRNCQSVSDVTQIIDHDRFQRPIYAGNALATVKVIRNDPKCKTQLMTLELLPDKYKIKYFLF